MTQPKHPISESERLDRIRLIRTENVGPITFHRLIERYGTAAEALAVLPGLAKRGGRSTALKIPSRADAEHELERNHRFGALMVCSCEAAYPEALSAVDDAPPVISVLGNAHLLKRPAVAIVGARNASLNGRSFAERLAHDLASAGWLVVSGLARGIDHAAHKGSLADGTVAVMAGGVDVIYPPEHADLHRAIAERGVIIAESPIGTTPQARHFPRRNRLISGMALGVVVVEAAMRSGSLITARLALDQGREVMAVPGSPLDPRCQGPNSLIQQGAALVQGAGDVLNILATLKPPVAREPGASLFGSFRTVEPDARELEKARLVLLENLSHSPVTIDELVRGCQLSAPVVLTALMDLELAGRVQRQPGNRINLL